MYLNRLFVVALLQLFSVAVAARATSRQRRGAARRREHRDRDARARSADHRWRRARRSGLGAAPRRSRNFWQEQPNEGQPASERTEVRVDLHRGHALHRRRDVRLRSVRHHRLGFAPRRADGRHRQLPDDRRHLSRSAERVRVRHQSRRHRIRRPGHQRRAGRRRAGLRPDAVGRLGLGLQHQLGCARGRCARRSPNRAGPPSLRFRSARCAIPSSDRARRGASTFQRNIRRKNERAYWAPIPRQFNLYRLSLAGSIGGVADAGAAQLPHHAVRARQRAGIGRGAGRRRNGLRFRRRPEIQHHAEPDARRDRSTPTSRRSKSTISRSTSIASRCSSRRSGRSSSRTPASSASAIPARSICSSAAASASATTASRFRSWAAAASPARPGSSTSAC